LRRPIEILLLSAGLLLVPAAAAIAQPYSYSISGLVGVGGSLDETDAGFGKPSWLVTFTSDIADKTYFAARLGGIHWSSEDQVGDTIGPSLLYVTLAGEYRETRASFSGGFVEPGVYIGLGFYSLDGNDEEGAGVSESAPGLVVGLTGDIALNSKRNLAMRIEISGHYAALDSAQLFGMVHLGLSYRF